MRFSTIIEGIQRFIKKISQIKIDLHLELKITKIKKRISYLSSFCSRSGATIEISLAFRNSLGGNNKEDAKKDLYLKGEYSNGEEVDLDEKLPVLGWNQKVWQLKIFNGTGTVRLTQADQGGGSTHLSETLTCERKKFEIVTPTFKKEEDWEKPISEISFVSLDCNSLTGRGICDIKI